MSDQGSFRLSPEQAGERVADSISLRKRREKAIPVSREICGRRGLGFLVLLFAGILSKGIPGLFQHYVTLDVQLDAERLDPSGQRTLESLADGDFDGVVRDALYEVLGGPTGRKAKRQARKLISSGSGQRLMHHVLDNPDQMRSTVALQFAVDDDVDTFLRGLISRDTPEADRRVSDQMISFVDLLQARGRISYEIRDYLFFGSASRDAEMAGIRGALVGSILTLLVCIVIAFPLGVATAVYLEEMAPKNRFTEIIEININNLAAVPSVVFGIMGLAIFIVIFGMPRSIPLVGGIVLALMTLPTIIISSRASIRAVPLSIRDAALGVGLENANHYAPCFTSRYAGHVDRHHHRDGPSFG